MRAASLQVCLASLLLLCFVYPQMGAAYPSAEGPSQWLLDQAKALQIDDATFGELWRTKQPVVITKPDADGQMCSVTYELSADGKSISRLTRRETQPASAEGPSQWLVDQARALQIDDAILGELWRTKQPVVITKPDAEGQIGSVTYELSADGTSISRTTRRGTQPARLETKVDASKPNEEWEPVPNQLQQQFTPILGTDLGFSLRNGFGSAFGSFGRSNGFPQRPANWPFFNQPPGITPRTYTKTEVDDQGRTVTSVSSYYSGPLPTGTNIFETQFPGSTAPNPFPPLPVQPTQPTQPFPGQAWPPSRPSLGLPLPELASPPSTTPLPSLAPSYGLEILTTTALPSLDDFLQQQTTPRLEGNPDDRPPPPLPTRRPLANGPQEGDKSIEDYLSKVNLSPSDIFAQNGEVVKTIVDKDGRVLSVRYVLSTVKEEEQRPQEPQSTK